MVYTVTTQSHNRFGYSVTSDPEFVIPIASWSLSAVTTESIIANAGFVPSFGSVGDAFDNAMMESFWSSMQNELPNRKKWKTRLELTNAIFDYVEVFYNRYRRHLSPDYVSPVEFELSIKDEEAA